MAEPLSFTTVSPAARRVIELPYVTPSDDGDPRYFSVTAGSTRPPLGPVLRIIEQTAFSAGDGTFVPSFVGPGFSPEIPPIVFPVVITYETYEGLDGTAALCGYSEYTSPSVPPKKYRVRTFSGGVDRNSFSDAACASLICHASEDYAGTCTYDAMTCGVTTAGTATRGGTCDAPSVTPTCTIGTGFSAGGDAVALTQTSKTITNPGTCFALNFGTSSVKIISITSFEMVSVEDGEDDAETRALVGFPWAITVLGAYRTTRGAGEFSFNFRKGRASALVGSFDAPLNVGHTYDVKFNLYQRNINSSDAWTFYGYMDKNGFPTMEFVATGYQMTVAALDVPRTPGKETIVMGGSVADVTS